MSGQQQLQTVPTGAVARQGFGESSMEQRAETATTAVAERARAAVQARYIVAMQRPRSWDDVRVRLLAECKRPGFAEVARYRKPVGRDQDGEERFVTGASVRFAEAAMRCMGNLDPASSVLHDSDAKRIVEVSLTDLEANLTYRKEIVIEKLVERSDPKGRRVVSERKNSRGKMVYTIVCTEDELLNKQNALESKAMRQHALRILPGDIHDEAMAQVERTRHDRAAQDPQAERKRIVDAFAAVGVKPPELEKFLGHSLDTVTPADLVDLRDAYGALKDAESSWDELLDARVAELQQKKGGTAGGMSAPPPTPPPAAAPTSAVPPASTQTPAPAPQASEPGSPPPPPPQTEASAQPGAGAGGAPTEMSEEEKRFTALYERIEHADSLDALSKCAKEINSFPSASQRDLWDLYKARKASVTGGAR